MAQTRMIDFLNKVEAFYGRLGTYYKELSDDSKSRDVKTILSHLSRHEENVRCMIQRYEEGADQVVLNTWFKVSPDFTQLKMPEDLVFSSEKSVDDIIQLAIDIDESLIDMYKLLIRESLDDEVKDVLNNLIQEEVVEKIKLMNIR
ncbi:MAG: hypothetical protein COA73_04180 [Candidatus Hydrogenedentota bacterium]|nr:MAG: hypothetical protein COA73_04180 [Candidatus Hydrogenedentota bacterium]